ncbi:hypothetical protein GUITHDRAFT_99724 [Guillardia theta CCMP2712]|uniref:Cytosolic iron-sulfur protein assembly protein CIAO1 homolog n=1 Tax=Guillardia theta (strain CCMP2712) TaxID=905079 RepID=L1K3P5_GUITC|nr:hypothetical protein GUITHDRAFT_99724 [Guillardia theta CCMP2712]EKX55090.1 hypothetical protein GUITHDRAFT_99724 [Guillardia theta CCMP2712]|eukprot:XP_005842070.1 hypothetical protein GUITHDRAFT_99724 [Guillardia theta CCMP2712]
MQAVTFPKPDKSGILVSLGFSLDGMMLTGGDNNGQVHVWMNNGQQKQSWSHLLTSKAHKGDVVSCVWSSSRKKGFHFLTAGHDKDVKFWMFKDGSYGQACNVIATFHTQHTEHISDCVWKDFRGTELLLTAGGDCSVRIHGKTGQGMSDWSCVTVLKEQKGNIVGIDVSISDDNKLSIVSSSFDKTAVIWSCSDDLEALVEGKCKDAEHWSLKTLAGSEVSQHGGDRRVSFCPTDGGLVAVACGKEVHLWEEWEEEKSPGRKWEKTATLQGHEGYINSLSFRDDGVLLASCDHMGGIKIWSRFSGSEREEVWGCIHDVSDKQGTLWSCCFGTARSAAVIVFAGFQGSPVGSDSSSICELQTERIRRNDSKLLDVARGVYEVANLVKAEGNQRYKEGQHERAKEEYFRCLSLFPSEQETANIESDELKEELKGLRATCHLNLAAVSLLLSDFHLAEEHSSLVLLADPTNPKGLYRKGMALLGQDKTEEATKWIMEAAKYMPEGDTQCATALQQIEHTKMYNMFGIGQDGKFAINELCYSSLFSCLEQKDKKVADELLSVLRGIHSGELALTKDGEQPPEVARALDNLDALVGDQARADLLMPLYMDKFSLLDLVQPSAPFGCFTGSFPPNQGCSAFALSHVDLTGADPSVIADAGPKWPKNNGFLRILPLLNFHRVILPQPGDLAVFTCGYVVEKDKVKSKSDGSSEDAIWIQSKFQRNQDVAYRHRIDHLPPHIFDVAGGGPFVYFFRRKT